MVSDAPSGAGTNNPARLFDIPFIRHGDEIVYVRRLYALIRKYRERSTEEDEFDWMSLCCFEQPIDKFYLVHEAVDWWWELDFERRQRMNVKGCRFIRLLNLEGFTTPPREPDAYYQAV